MKTYSILYNDYKEEMTRWGIMSSVPAAKIRNVIATIFLFVLLGLALYLWVMNRHSTPHSIFLVCVMCFFVGIYFVIQHFDKRSLLKKYSSIPFTKTERKDVIQLVSRIQAEMLSNYIGERKNNQEYIKNLIECSKEQISETKIELSAKNLGITGVLIIIFHNFCSVVYEKWKEEPQISLASLTDRTGIMIGILIFFYILYHLYKKSLHNLLNTKHKYHKEIYFILKDIETTNLLK